MRFYLGVHRANWLTTARVPLFVSHRILGPRKSLPRAAGPWSLDSGGFTELTLYGGFVTTPQEYAEAALRYQSEIGLLDWAAPQDWMCEPFMLAKTGLTIEEHQERTVESVLLLRQLAPSVHFAPVLQGWKVGDYMAHVRRYERAGIDLTAEPIVGIGSVCRRQFSAEIGELVGEVASCGIRLHGFGVKVRGIGRYAGSLTSADSMAWSFAARMEPPMEGHTHKACANCLVYALNWRERIMGLLNAVQMPLPWSRVA